MDISSVALQGLNKADLQLDNAASKIAGAGSSVSAGQLPVDTVDISQEAVSMLSAKNAFEANIKTLEVSNQMQQYAMDMIKF
jgi:flagellar basal body rod protein FlgC